MVALEVPLRADVNVCLSASAWTPPKGRDQLWRCSL